MKQGQMGDGVLVSRKQADEVLVSREQADESVKGADGCHSSIEHAIAASTIALPAQPSPEP